ncbi:MAG: hypothetical protein MUD00_02185 [Candidatus Pacebacteria bacterium]|nr:hypothetical protein [Candidatus Paceibacterota bacterium]
MDNIFITQNTFGVLWTIGWLFTIGYLRLTFWKGVLAIFVWPYYIGKKFYREQ